MIKIPLAIALTVFTLSTNAYASEKHHFPGVFLGATTIASKTDFSWGLEYEYKFADRWGVGAVYEETNNALDGIGIEVKLASLYFHPINHMRLGLGFGEEKVKGGFNIEEDLVRVSASWEVPVSSFEIAPTLAYDFVDGNTSVVIGAAFIYPF